MQLTTCKRVAVHLSTMPQLEARLHRLRSVDEQHQGRRSRVDGQKARLRVRPTISACCGEFAQRAVFAPQTQVQQEAVGAP